MHQRKKVKMIRSPALKIEYNPFSLFPEDTRKRKRTKINRHRTVRHYQYSTNQDYRISIFFRWFAKGHFMQVMIEVRILSLDEQTISIDSSSFEYLFGQQHESSIFVIRWFHSFSDQPFYTVRTILSRVRREREKNKRKRRENNYSAIVTTANQNTHTFIHTDAYTSISLLQIIRSRSRTRITQSYKKISNACWSFCTLSITGSYQSKWISKGKGL